jgi:hypothetical protein
MSALKVEFRGMCLSSVVGKKVAYTTFCIEPDLGMPAQTFQVSCVEAVQPAEFMKMADWKLEGLVPVSGSANGKSYAFFRCAHIHGEFVKEKVKA